jgi:hypothetical protein
LRRGRSSGPARYSPFNSETQLSRRAFHSSSTARHRTFDSNSSKRPGDGSLGRGAFAVVDPTRSPIAPGLVDRFPFHVLLKGQQLRRRAGRLIARRSGSHPAIALVFPGIIDRAPFNMRLEVDQLFA